MKSYTHQCACCGAAFVAGHRAAKWCSFNCKSKAAYRRRLQRMNGQPEALATVRQEDRTEAREWNGTAIQRRQSDGFVNATAMCQATGKRWNHYAANERTQEYITALQLALSGETHSGAAVAGNPATLPDVVEVIQGGLPYLQGTWVHPRLAVDLARWISPAFAVWMDGWFLETISQPRDHRFTIPARSRQHARILWMDAVWRHFCMATDAQLQEIYRVTPLPSP